MQTELAISQVDSEATGCQSHIWVVIAAYHEAERIGAVVDGVRGCGAEVVVVDDGSTDDTADSVLARAVWLLRHSVNLGQGAALQTGIDFALSQGAHYIVTFDADGQHDPADIPRLIEALQINKADYALGSRFLGTADGIPAMRRFVLSLAVWYTRWLSGARLTDAHNGLRAMTRRGASDLRITLNRMEHASEIIDQIVASGLKYVEVPVRIRYTPDTLAKGQRSSAAIKMGLKLVLEKVFR
ncbi:MAG: glycosyltransferase family 2 protein [Pirellulaceae bacterium]|nr:glycosyltransferase family 2 protein [Pirellulaceae bacterium]